MAAIVWMHSFVHISIKCPSDKLNSHEYPMSPVKGMMISWPLKTLKPCYQVTVHFHGGCHCMRRCIDFQSAAWISNYFGTKHRNSHDFGFFTICTEKPQGTRSKIRYPSNPSLMRLDVYMLISPWNLANDAALLWCHNGCDGVSNHQPQDCLLNRLFRCRSKKTPKLRVIGLCEGNSPVTSEFPHMGPVTRKAFPFDDVIMERQLRGFYRNETFDRCVAMTDIVWPITEYWINSNYNLPYPFSIGTEN